MEGQRPTICKISYSMDRILLGNDSACCSTEPQWHNNQVVKTTPINRAARKEVKVEGKAEKLNRHNKAWA